MTMFRSEEDKMWYEIFKAALVGSAQLNPEKAAERAATIADDAIERVKTHMHRDDPKPDANAELFKPYLEKEKAKREKDEADSAFTVAR